MVLPSKVLEGVLGSPKGQGGLPAEGRLGTVPGETHLQFNNLLWLLFKGQALRDTVLDERVFFALPASSPYPFRNSDCIFISEIYFCLQAGGNYHLTP